MLTELVHQKNCKKHEIVTDIHTGEIACSNCGIVSSEPIIDLGAEMSGGSSADYQNNSRVGAKRSLKMIDMGLSTLIEAKDKDVTGKSLSVECGTETVAQLSRLNHFKKHLLCLMQ